jgi:hypothetical protein
MKKIPAIMEFPYVTGFPEAVELIETGDILAVDGYQGIVTIEKRYLQKKLGPGLRPLQDISTVSMACITDSDQPLPGAFMALAFTTPLQGVFRGR